MHKETLVITELDNQRAQVSMQEVEVCMINQLIKK